MLAGGPEFIHQPKEGKPGARPVSQFPGAVTDVEALMELFGPAFHQEPGDFLGSEAKDVEVIGAFVGEAVGEAVIVLRNAFPRREVELKFGSCDFLSMFPRD